MRPKPDRAFIGIEELWAIYEKVSAKELSTAKANKIIEAARKPAVGAFVQIPLSPPEGSKRVWLLYMRLWLDLRSPSWRYRPYEGECDPITVGSSEKTIRLTAEHIESLIAMHQLEPPRGGWMAWHQYLQRGAGLLRDKITKPAWQLGSM